MREFNENIGINITFHSIATLIGIKAALQLCRDYEGNVLRIPQGIRGGQRLEKIIGKDAAKTLSDEYGGLDYAISVRAKILSLIIDSLERGTGTNATARKVGVTKPTVIKVKKQLRQGVIFFLGKPYPLETALRRVKKPISPPKPDNGDRATIGAVFKSPRSRLNLPSPSPVVPKPHQKLTASSGQKKPFNGVAS